jgi:hypothetical protein
MNVSSLGRRAALLALPVALAFAGAKAQAQAPHPPIRGTIEAAAGDRLEIVTRDGEHVAVRLTEGVAVTAMVKASLADIKPDSYVGMTNRVAADGRQTAVEVHIFPEVARGTGDGERPWDLGPNSRMTNGAVHLQVTSVEGQEMTVKYATGESRILVTPQTPVVAYERGSRAELTPGSKVFIRQLKALPDGGLETSAVAVGRDGLTPPM